MKTDTWRGLDQLENGAPPGSKWYADWQSREHAKRLDSRSVLTDRALARNYEVFNDVRLLNEYLDRSRQTVLVEVGCATGEFSRYLRRRHPQVCYIGVDVSRVAIARAQEKYPHERFVVTDLGTPLTALAEALQLPGRPEIVYAKDVAHHQVDPLRFISELLRLAREAVILRLRTRDRGATVTDPEVSCQYHYDGWMPYIILNLQELIDHVRLEVPGAELVIYQHYVVLGGRENRFLPKDCYLPQTGTAETAIGVWLKTPNPGKVTIVDRPEEEPVYPLGERVVSFGRKVVRALHR